MVIASRPVYSDIGDASKNDVGGIDASSCGQLAEMVESLKAWTIKALVNFEQRFQFDIIPNFTFFLIFVVVDDFFLLASDPFFKVVDVRGIMEEVEFVFGGFLALEHGEVVAQLVALDEGMGHLDAFCLHGVLLAEVVVGDRVVVEVTYLTHQISIIETITYFIFISHSMLQDTQQFYPFDDDKHEIKVTVCNPTEKKTTLSSFTVYTVRGEDNEGSFDYEKRYSDFNHIRAALSLRWPGCFIPPLPPKKLIGNTQSNFVEERLTGLDVFMKQIALLKHLWYSKQFQMFLRSSGDLEKQLKPLLNQSHQEIIKRYDETFPKLSGKGQDTMILGRVLDFGNYCKKIIPVLTNFKEMALSYVMAKNATNQQFSILLNYVLPKYEESCLSVYCNKITQGKFIFNEKSDQKLAEYIEQFKKLIAQQHFEQLYRNLQLEEREIQAFLQAIRVKETYDSKMKDLKSKQKDLEVQLVKLNAGKQGVFSSLVSNLQSSKAKANQQLQTTREEMNINSFMLDMVVILLGYFEIPRFRQQKLKTYFNTIKKMAAFQIRYTGLRAKICEHVLDNHNLL